MERTLSKNAKSNIGKRIQLKGWLHSLRLLGKVNFLILRDRSALVQVVINEKEELLKVKDLQPGSVLTIVGDVVESKQTELGVEIVNPKITVEVSVNEPLPVEYNKEDVNAEIETILDYRPLTLRNLKQQAIFKVQATILEAFGNAMRNEGFTEFRSPVLQGVPSESGASVFEVKYYDNKAYLAQSPQIYKQIMVGVFERAFTVTPVFRAEKHNTSRHIMELTQMDGEMGFITDYDDVLQVVESVVKEILKSIGNKNKKELDMWKVELPILPKDRFPKIKVKDALKIIEERTGRSAKREELDLDPEDEREIGRYVKEKYNSDFLWLLNFKKDKNFYTWNNPDDPDESLSFDLECRGLEWLSGTHRIHDYQHLLERFEKQGLTKENYEHYFQAFKYGIPAEAGFSLGLERMTMQILELKNIREATLFPSDLKRVAGAKIKVKAIFGGENVRNKIVEKLNAESIEFQHIKHEPTPTSEDSAKVRDMKIEEGVKAIILRGKKTSKNIMVCIPGNLRVNMKAFDNLGEKFEFEKAENVVNKFGIEIGGVPPFGHLLGMETYYDVQILNHENVAFNCGLNTETIKLKSKDLIDIVSPTLGKYV